MLLILVDVDCRSSLLLHDVVFAVVFFTEKGEVQTFQELYPSINHGYQKIYIKVFNERKTAKERAAKRLNFFT
jgi:hypothetical protein